MSKMRAFMAAASPSPGLRRHLLLGLSVFALGLVLQMPAPLAYHWLRPKLEGGPELLGVQGSLLQGRVSSVSLQGKPALSGLSWDLQPFWLLLGNASARIKAQAEQTLLESRVSAWPGGRVGISNLQFSGRLQTLAAAAGQPFLPLDGMVRIADGQVRLSKGWPQSAQGTVEVHDLAYTLAASPITFGDYEIKIEDGKDSIVAKIASTSGPLELKGEASLKPDRSYQLEMSYRPKAEASAVLRNLLASGGAPDASGWYHVRQQKQAPVPAADAEPATADSKK